MRKEDLNVKIVKYSIIGLTILSIIVLGILLYSKKLNEDVREGTLTSEKISSLLSNSSKTENIESTNEINTNTEKTERVSTQIGKSVEESKNVLSTNTVKPVENKTTDNTTNDKNETKENNVTKSEEKTVELNFAKPVEGEIVRDYAKENLIYSETLQEWVTHTGVDIKADKTTVVKSAEAGTVKTIKNDPRYGLTIVIEHQNGFQTVYSNLLTSEFVVEGEKVEKGQSLGTVGNTAAFEIADEAHLHFEVIKDGVQVDPNIYLK